MSVEAGSGVLVECESLVLGSGLVLSSKALSFSVKNVAHPSRKTSLSVSFTVVIIDVIANLHYNNYC